jgi:DNA modification methylase
MLYQGDCLEILPTLEANSIQCVVTSPPYWGLRDYGVEGQLGLEKTPEEYVGKMVAVFREVRRVLRDDGTLWLNLGDTYSAHKDCKSIPDSLRVGGGSETANIIEKGKSFSRDTKLLKSVGLKNKDLIGIPWRVAFALQADGWWLRQDIIWAKPNPMPESVTDRCTKSHEYIFLLTKSAKYYYDNEAVKESGQIGSPNRMFGAKNQEGTMRQDIGRTWTDDGTRNKRSVWTITTKPFKSVFSYGKYRIASPNCPVHDYHADLGRALECDALLASSQIDRMMNNGIHPFPLQEGVVVSIPLDHPLFPFDGISAIPHSMRNYRTADELKQDEIFFGISPYRTEYKELIDHSISKCVRTRGSNTEVDVFQGVSGTYPSGQTRYRIFCILTWQSPPSGCLCHYTGDLKKGQDHFAVFPPEIPEICIKAGTSEKGCCPECGSPWERVIEKKKIPRDELPKDDPRYRPNRYHDNKYANEIRNGYECGMYSESITIGWRPTCTHNLDPIPCTVLDPFAGAGTTGMIAEKLDRKFIGIELNPEYAKMGERRIEAAELPLFTNLSTVGQCEDIC